MVSEGKIVPTRKSMIIKAPQFDPSATKPGQVVMLAFHRGRRNWPDIRGIYYAGIVNDVRAFELRVSFFSEASDDMEHISITMDELLRGDFSLLNVSSLTDQDIAEVGANPITFAVKYGHRFAVERDTGDDENPFTS